MPRMLAPLVVLSLMASATGTSRAYWLGEENYCECQGSTHKTVVGECCEKVKEGYHYNNMWPQQYLGLERERARSPFDRMTANGWRRQNLIGSHHFNDDTTEITKAGKLRVQWILTQNPQQFRTVFIETSLRNSVNERRMALVEEFASEVVGHGGSSVNRTHIISDGRPAPVVDFVNTKFQENMPVPQLPESAFRGLDAEQ